MASVRGVAPCPSNLSKAVMNADMSALLGDLLCTRSSLSALVLVPLSSRRSFVCSCAMVCCSLACKAVRGDTCGPSLMFFFGWLLWCRRSRQLHVGLVGLWQPHVAFKVPVVEQEGLCQCIDHVPPVLGGSVVPVYKVVLPRNQGVVCELSRVQQPANHSDHLVFACGTQSVRVSSFQPCMPRKG